ncbi:hypothetical protein SG34_027645 [Thalassomonas viridans]|uniref:TonB C-terminal domain-containing protein n=1 Tax=Thalassomonas viridans TaxID=137584 RepID=A0AAE9Z1D4_9GAMM|nr:hypothetical protein [Thalassomonas viridans]WDE05031.1 hypothetical protein SG34_027645 [Thalassomonas viridans]
MKSCLFTFLLYLTLSFSSIAADYTPAEIIEDRNPASTETANQSRLEGWILVTYLVDLDGKASHIEVIAQSKQQDVYNKVKRHLEHLHFSPATVAGKAVISSQRLFYYTDKTLFDNPNNGISQGFRKKYNRANQHIGNKEFAKAKEALDDLQEINTKNLKEQALSAWLYSQYYFSQSDWPAYAEQTKIAAYLKDYLPAKWAVTAIQNLMQWHVFKKEYTEAFAALAELKSIKGANVSEDVYQDMYQSLKKLLQEDTNIEIEHTLSDNTVWFHRMSRRKLSLTPLSGEIEAIELRCKNNRLILTLEEAKAVTLDNNDLACSLLVKGSEGSKVSLTESGDLYRFSS